MSEREMDAGSVHKLVENMSEVGAILHDRWAVAYRVDSFCCGEAVGGDISVKIENRRYLREHQLCMHQGRGVIRCFVFGRICGGEV